MQKDYDYIIVGGGLCGLVLAKALVAKNKRVLVLEQGGFLNRLGTVIKAVGFYDRYGLAGSNEGVPIYRAFGVGGTSIISCGNAVEFSDSEYNRIGVDLKSEIPEAKKESFVREQGLTVGRASQKIMDSANQLGYPMHPMPKFNLKEKCASCGKCYLGCPYNSKWTARECLKEIGDRSNFRLVTGVRVENAIISSGKVTGVSAVDGRGKQENFFARKVILSAGGIGTPIILQNSGIEAGDNLFVDLFNVTYGPTKEFDQSKELTMSVVCGHFHQEEGFVLSPFVDNYYSLFFCTDYPHSLNSLRINRLMGIMTKIADDSIGTVHRDGKISKTPTKSDLRKLKKGSEVAKEILIKCGVKPQDIFFTRPRGAHPGGTAGIGRVVNSRLESKIPNLYVCDASVLPFAPGLPPMLALIALSKWFAKNILEPKTIGEIRDRGILEKDSLTV